MSEVSINTTYSSTFCGVFIMHVDIVIMMKIGLIKDDLQLYQAIFGQIWQYWNNVGNF